MQKTIIGTFRLIIIACYSMWALREFRMNVYLILYLGKLFIRVHKKKKKHTMFKLVWMKLG